MSEEHRIVVNDEIHLSPLRPDDRSAVADYLNDRDIYEQTLRIPFPYTVGDFDTFLEITRDETAKRGHPIHFAIRDTDDQPLGAFGFEGLYYDHRVEIGYWLAKPYWGRGIMTETVRAMCEYAFAQWKLVRILAHAFVFNPASARVLEKNGFQLEGVLRKHQFKDGNYIDAKLYALVR